MRERISGFWGFLTENFKWLLLIAVAYLIAVQTGWIQPLAVDVPDVPEWFQLVIIGGILAGLVTWIAAGRIIRLLPDPPRRYIVVQTESPENNRIWKLTPDAFEEVTVEDGRLYQWEKTIHPTYEAESFDPEELHAVGTWRENVPASEVIGKSDVKQAIKLIMEVRRKMEKEARLGRLTRDNIGAIVRALDRERAKSQDRALEEHTAPSVGDGRSVDEIITETLGELAPDHLTVDQEDMEEIEEAEGGVLEVIDADSEALEPVRPNGGENDNEQ